MTRFLPWLGTAAASALLAATMTLLSPGTAMAAGPHDCRTTGRAAETMQDASDLALLCNEVVRIEHNCPCGKRWTTDGQTWERS